MLPSKARIHTTTVKTSWLFFCKSHLSVELAIFKCQALPIEWRHAPKRCVCCSLCDWQCHPPKSTTNLLQRTKFAHNELVHVYEMHVQPMMSLITFRFYVCGADFNKLQDLHVFLCHIAQQTFQTHCKQVPPADLYRTAFIVPDGYLLIVDIPFVISHQLDSTAHEFLCFWKHTHFAHCKQVQWWEPQWYKWVHRRARGDVLWPSNKRSTKHQYHACASLFLLVVPRKQRASDGSFWCVTMTHKLLSNLLHPTMR